MSNKFSEDRKPSLRVLLKNHPGYEWAMKRVKQVCFGNRLRSLIYWLDKYDRNKRARRYYTNGETLPTVD